MTAPAPLARRIARIAVAPNAETARRAQADLPVGARIVTRDGGMWRWDGFSIAPGAPSSAAIRLERRNRLVELDRQIADTERRRNDSLEVSQRAERALADADAQVEIGRARLSDAGEALSRAKSVAAELASRVAAVETKLSALDDGAARLATEKAEAEEQKTSAEAGLAEIPDIDALRREMPEVPGVITATRGNHGQSVARAAVAAGLKATIYIPHGNSVEERRHARLWGLNWWRRGRTFRPAMKPASLRPKRRACTCWRASTRGC